MNYVQSLKYNDIQILESLSIDVDCGVVKGMGEATIAFKEPRKKEKQR